MVLCQKYYFFLWLSKILGTEISVDPQNTPQIIAYCTKLSQISLKLPPKAPKHDFFLKKPSYIKTVKRVIKNQSRYIFYTTICLDMCKIGTSTLHVAWGGTGPQRCDFSKIGVRSSSRCRMGCQESETLTHIIMDCTHYKDYRLKLVRECDRLFFL